MQSATPKSPRARFVLGNALLLVVALGGGVSCGTLEPAAEAPAGPDDTSAPQARATRQPAASPPARPAAPPAPAPPRPRVLLVTSTDSPGSREVEAALEARLAGRYRLERVALDGDARGAVAETEPVAAVAIGADAAELASRELGLPVVFCRVFDYERLLSLPTRVHGVAALPPLELQLESWRRIAPDAATLGVLIGEDHRALVDEARRAAAARGIDLEARFVRSDREMVYRFKRLAPRVDGLWLFPDNDILAPRAVREMLEYAFEHGIHSIVFTASLLDWGALLSVESRPEDVAARVAHVLEALTSENGVEPPAVTPLSDVDMRVNESVAAALGLSPHRGERARAAR